MLVTDALESVTSAHVCFQRDSTCLFRTSYRRSLVDTSVLFRCRTMEKSPPNEQHRFDASNDQILPKGWHWTEPLESKLTMIDGAIRKLNEDFDNCKNLIAVMMRQRNTFEVEMLRLFSRQNEWLKILHRTENERRKLIEMESRGRQKNRKKYNDPYDGLVMSSSTAQEFRDRLDGVTNNIMSNMIAQAKIKKLVQKERIHQENMRETLFALAVHIARQRRSAMDTRNSLMTIKNRVKDNNLLM